jgi:hypothetical protein
MNSPGYPQQPQGGPPGQYPQQPPKSGGALKTVLIVLCVVLVLGFGACFATCMVARSAVQGIAESIGDGGMALVAPPEVKAELAGPKKDYVGNWKSAAGSTLSIDEDGQFQFNKTEGGKTGNFNAPIGGFEGADIVVKIFVKITFKVTPPKKVGSEYEIIVDGVKLKRMAD